MFSKSELNNCNAELNILFYHRFISNTKIKNLNQVNNLLHRNQEKFRVKKNKIFYHFSNKMLLKFIVENAFEN